MKKKKWVFWLVILMLLGYEAVHKEAEITGNDLTDRRSKVITAGPGRTDITVISIKQIYQETCYSSTRNIQYINQGLQRT